MGRFIIDIISLQFSCANNLSPHNLLKTQTPLWKVQSFKEEKKKKPTKTCK